jgi:PTH1 family peptidyl-tRNA hydrolase
MWAYGLISGILIELERMFKIRYLTGTDVPQKNDSGETSKIKLVAGLGNPGDEYRDTFHNVGFMFVDFLAEKNRQKVKKYRDFEFLKIGGFVAIKPLGFMNLSGVPIKRALRHFDTRMESLVVIHDDSDIKLGQYKISSGRGSAGHKGVESIFKELKTNEFTRIRIGIRKKYGASEKDRHKAGDFVLKKVGEKDKRGLEKIFLEIITLHLEV